MRLHFVQCAGLLLFSKCHVLTHVSLEVLMCRPTCRAHMHERMSQMCFCLTDPQVHLRSEVQIHVRVHVLARSRQALVKVTEVGAAALQHNTNTHAHARRHPQKHTLRRQLCAGACMKSLAQEGGGSKVGCAGGRIKIWVVPEPFALCAHTRQRTKRVVPHALSTLARGKCSERTGARRT